jgi:hypothetical protein
MCPDAPRLLPTSCLAFPCNARVCSFPCAFAAGSQFDHARLWGEIIAPAAIRSSSDGPRLATCCCCCYWPAASRRERAAEHGCNFMLHACCHIHGYSFVLRACCHACLVSHAHAGQLRPLATPCWWNACNIKHLLQYTPEIDERITTYTYNICVWILQHMQHPDKKTCNIRLKQLKHLKQTLAIYV